MFRTMVKLGMTLGVACLFCGAAQADTVAFKGTMSGATEVPAKTTDGKGTVSASLDTSTKVLTYGVEYSGLSGPASAAHFHGPAEPGKNAGVVLPFPTPTSPIQGTATLTDAQVAELMAGQWYANVHTAANPAGEIRGQLVRAQ